MPWTSEHTKWLVDTGERLKTADGIFAPCKYFEAV